ncbi:HDOD domain-containing protein [Aestuariirhabdus litorea]|uniref:HDOD domain-containing protein n=1 Tax=Aestuariirhabdus litorea TaxID=2528527 RepID=A0A3P3VIY9_9GAMM|nr:HDOD domain-containing protein [Aestuariirhabdus litorea]RRJ82324.1 HDOD domain-containing protein [Aestuariirhabdus litorea]RWW92489.1 HDOD domain-containing protein [Endozoicomonadaceae bacterium GTF-13]
MSSDHTTYSMEHWQQLLTQNPLPVMARSHADVCDALKNEDVSLYRLAQLIRPCPVICLHVFAAVNRQRKPGAPRVNNLEHALSLMGLTPLEQLMASLEPIHPLRDLASQRYSQAITASYHAARQALCWYEYLNREASEGVFWSTLFAQMIRWPLWLYAPDAMQRLQDRQAQGGDPSQNEADVLGGTIDELALMMDSHWPLPRIDAHDLELMQSVSGSTWLQLSRVATKPSAQRYTHAPLYDRYLRLLHEDRAIKLIRNGHCGAVMLANRIAQEATHSWYSKGMRRLLRLLALFTSSDLEKAAELSHQAAINTSREQRDWLMPAPAAALLWPTPLHEPKIKPTEAVPASAQDSIQPAPPQRPPARKANPARFKEIYQQLTSAPQEIKDLPQLVDLLGEALFEGMGFDRVVIALPNKERSSLISFRRYGDDSLRFALDLTPASLLRSMMQKPAAIWIKGPSQQAIWSQIPAPFKKLVNHDQFFLRSLFAGSRSAALLFVDMGVSKRPLSDKHYQYFQTLCKAAGPALTHLAQGTKTSRQGSA